MKILVYHLANYLPIKSIRIIGRTFSMAFRRLTLIFIAEFALFPRSRAFSTNSFARSRVRGSSAVNGWTWEDSEKPSLRSTESGENDYSIEERGLKIDVTTTFFRAESSTSRDLSVLAAELLKRETGSGLRVIDAYAGVGTRACRYLAQAGAEFVHVNDANEDTVRTLVGNLERHSKARDSWLATQQDANKILLEYALRSEYFDIVDCDVFGLSGRTLTSALMAVKHGGYVYVTNTDGRTSSGKAPGHALAEYGSWAIPHAASNEQGMRLLIGAAAKAAAPLRLVVTPVFSLFSRHGPVFRTMLKVTHSTRPDLCLEKNYRYTAHCRTCGQMSVVPWEQLGDNAACSCTCAAKSKCNNEVQSPDFSGGRSSRKAAKLKTRAEKYSTLPSCRLNGPLWVGPLHDGEALRVMHAIADERGWDDLNPTFKAMESELDKHLPPLYYSLSKIWKLAKVNPPGRARLESLLRAQGFACGAPHADTRDGLKTNASVAACVAAAKQAAIAASEERLGAS